MRFRPLTPFDETKHRSWRDLPADVALVLVAILVIILIASTSTGGTTP